MSDKSVKTTHQFSKLRTMLWPIHSYELKKVIPMGLLLFCMLFEYTIVRVLKDNFVLSAPAGGAALIPFLKTMLVLPSAAGFVALYAYLNKRFAKKTVFYIVTGSFGFFFAFFGNVLFSHSAMIHMSDAKLALLATEYPRLAGVSAMMGLWSYSLFYVLAELWGTVGITQMFWQFANEITTTDESKRFYITFQSISNFALIMAALTIDKVFVGTVGLSIGSVKLACNLVALFTIISLGLYYFINSVIAIDAPIVKEVKSKKPKPGLVDSAKIILKSRYLAYIALLLICYGVAINLVEVTWKDLMKAHSKASGIPLHVFQAKAFLYTGITAVIIATFGKGIVAAIGWRTTALVTPIGMLLSGLLFFAAILSPDLIATLSANFGYTALGFGVLIGTIQNVFAKSTKYVLFDVTKEMSYIPLDATLKDEGKAAVEVIGGRAGKAMGSAMQVGLFMIAKSSDLSVLTPYLALGLFIICMLWITIVNLLAIDYNALLQKKAHKA